MRPADLSADSFSGYPPQARALSAQHLPLLRQLPLVFAALLLREIARYDWSFPAERRTIDDQVSYLESLPASSRETLLRGFALDPLPGSVADVDWVRRPEVFVEALTAWLWSSHRIDAFHSSADEYAAAWRKARPEPLPPAPRLAIVVLGAELTNPKCPLFRKLRPHGVFIPAVESAGAWDEIQSAIARRTQQHPDNYGHWYVDGGAARSLDARLTTVSWEALRGVRTAVLNRMQSVIASGQGGPEELRTRMAEIQPCDAGLPASATNDVLVRFEVSLLTEGSGTQIFSTTFVQWAAREILRRAQPCTLLLRFAPRQRQLPMDELLAGTGDSRALDPAGSLIDADMGAWYTWIDQQRLTGADQASFIAWSEAHRQAVAIGPAVPRGVVAPNTMTMTQIFQQFL